MKHLLNKFKDMISDPAQDQPQVSHRVTVLNDVIRKGQRPGPVHDDTINEKIADDPRVAFIQERNEVVESDDPYNSSDYDRGKSWKPGGDR